MPVAQEEKAFLEEIRNNPGDLFPYQVYADWLTEQGDLRGEAIRVACELENAELSPAEYWALHARHEKLEKAAGRRWAGFLKGVIDGRRDKILMDRGVVCGIRTRPDRWKNLAPQLLEEFPSIVEFQCTANSFETATEFREFLNLPTLKSITRLNLRSQQLQDDSAMVLAQAPILEQLTHLNLSNNWIHWLGAAALFEAESLQGLVSLDLSDCFIRAEGAEALANSKSLSNLTELNLGNCWILPDGLLALLAKFNLSQLESLNLGGNYLWDAHLHELLSENLFPKLRALDLSMNQIQMRGISLLAESTLMDQLTHLNLGQNLLGPEAVRVLVNSSKCENLHELNFSKIVQLTSRTVSVLTKAKPLDSLRLLVMKSCHSLGPRDQQQLEDHFGPRIQF